MEKKIENFMHLYLGCNIYYTDTNEVSAISWTHLLDKFTVDKRCEPYNPGFKLLLRPLSDMSPEELQECGNMVYDFSDDADLNNHKWKNFETLLDPLQFVWLLERGFDLFGLIESGL